jgi:thioredoxin reductase (NADPH)
MNEHQPLIVAVDTEGDGLNLLESELRRRYECDYGVFITSSADAALQRLEEARAAAEDVAVILAGCWLAQMDGIEFVEKARDFYPHARYGLLVDMGDREAGQMVLQATALGIVDGYGPRPLHAPDEGFNHYITRFLQEWHSEHRGGPKLVRIVGNRWEPRGHELRDLMQRNSLSYGFYDMDSEEGRALLAQAGADGQLPLVVLADGRSLFNPTNAELARALDVLTIYDLSEVPYDEVVDVVVVGAGPAGLSAAVYAASEGLRTVVIEREAIGGQAGMSSRIRNYLGFPSGIPGDELASRAYQQAWLFGADFSFGYDVVGMDVDGPHRILHLDDGKSLTTRAVVLAMGADYRHLDVPEVEAFTGAGVFYGAAAAEALVAKGEHVYVVGGGNSAGQAATFLAKHARWVTMVVRSSSLALKMSEYLIREIEHCDNVDVRVNTEIVGGGGTQRLEWLDLYDEVTGATERVKTPALFVLIGANPYTDWLPPAVQRRGTGYIPTGTDLLEDGQPPDDWPLQRPPFLLESSVPGVFAAGDVRFRSAKRVASAVGEGSITVHFIHQYLGELARA